MKKGIALITMLLALVVMLSGCNLIGYDAELDAAQVVAKVNDNEITKADWLGYRDYMASYYQEYYQQYFGFTMPMDEETIASYGESALEEMVRAYVIQDKIKELGFDPLPEEDLAGVEEYANSMYDFYKMMIRVQNYPELETVEEEQERLAAAEGEEAAAEPVATITDAMLDEMLVNDMNTIGYTLDYFITTETGNVQNDKLFEHATADVVVTDEQVKAEFDRLAAQQKETYDANPAAYANAEQSGTTNYYVPAGYRGVKNLLIKIADEKQTEIDALQNELTVAQNALADANEQLESLKAEDTAEYDAETMESYNAQITALEEQAVQAQATIDETQPELDAATEAAFAQALTTAQEVQARIAAGEDFDALLETYGQDGGMTTEPAKTTGYLVCEGLTLYEQSFQDAAMALESVGAVSAEPVKSSYGYHILKYATDVESGEVEYTDEIKTAIHDTMLETEKNTVYEAAVTQWISEAKVETFPKVME